MNVHRYDEDQRRQWVREKIGKKKSVRQILQEAVISRATLYNWIDEFGDEPEMQNIVPEEDYLNKWAGGNIIHNANVPPPADMPGTRYKMLLSALGKVDTDGQLSRKMVAVLVRRFTLTVAQACEMVGLDEATYGYKPRKPETDDQAVYEEMARLLAEEPSRTFIQLYDLLQQSHPAWPRKQIKRVYRERRLYLKRTRVKRSAAPVAEGSPAVLAPIRRLDRTGSCWNAGVVMYGEDNNKWILFILDDADGVPLNAIQGEGGISHNDLQQFLNMATEENGAPRKLRIPGREPFNEKEIQRWAWSNKIALHVMNLNKEENMEEIQKMEDRISEELSLPPTGTAGQKRDVEGWLHRQLSASL